MGIIGTVLRRFPGTPVDKDKITQIHVGRRAPAPVQIGELLREGGGELLPLALGPAFLQNLHRPVGQGDGAEISWKDGKLIFNDTPLDEVLHMLGKRFNVEFVLSNKGLKGCSFTGTFTHQRLERIMEYFRISSHIRWRYIDSADIKTEKLKIEVY